MQREGVHHQKSPSLRRSLPHCIVRDAGGDVKWTALPLALHFSMSLLTAMCVTSGRGSSSLCYALELHLLIVSQVQFRQMPF